MTSSSPPPPPSSTSLCLCLSWKKWRGRNDHSVPPPPPGYNTCNSTQEGSNLEMKGKLEDITVDSGASSSTAAPGSTYEVFLSFRGADIRLGFTDHLYCNLKGAGIRTFRDKEELRVGKDIRPDLLKAIEESTISIPIFSKGYASSKWCLMELAQMVKCMKSNHGYTICPIFYDVTPSNVRHQTGNSFRKAFIQHKKNFDEVIIQEWKDALKEVSQLSGWEKDKIADGHEGQLVDIIVREVCMMLKKRNVHLTGDLVGMDRHREEMSKLLDIDSGNGARIVGIIGMGGIGKTTIAKYMYNQLCDCFQQQCSFLEDVKENLMRKGCAKLQRQLMSDVLKRSADRIRDIRKSFIDKKVLIVLDDVENRTQLTDIIGGLANFGSGSRIIVTTRNKDVFIEKEGDLIYEPSVMDPEDSLLLFRKYAFKSTQPRDGYEEISREIAQTAAGLPLSLVAIGSMLFRKESQEDWEATLEKLKTIPANDVQERLKISYDALTHDQKQMFLDIACHFIGKDKTNAIHMWEACGLNPKCEGIDVLCSLSLITIENLHLSVDRDFFRMHDQLRDLGRDIVKKENRSHPGQRSRLWSIEEVREVLDKKSGTENVEAFSMKYGRDSDYSNDNFKRMSSLRYLCLERVSLKGDFKGLVSNLRWFRWSFYDEIRVTNFCANKLVVLDLTDCNGISDGWESAIQIEAATNLKVLRLRGCRFLRKLPECLWNMKFLVELDLSDTVITELSEQGIENLTNLIKLLLSRSSIKRLPDAIGKLKKLEVLDCFWSPLEGQLPEGIWRMSSLRVLNLTCTITTGGLPKDISGLSKLETLDLGGCDKLQLPVEKLILPLSLIKLCIPLTEASLNGLRGLVNLRDLRFMGYCCEPVEEEVVGVDMPSNLESLTFMGLFNQVKSCRLLRAMKFDSSSRLNSLRILYCTFETLPVGSLDLSNFQVLKELTIEHCRELRDITCLEVLTSLEYLTISDCPRLKKPDLSNIKGLKTINRIERHEEVEW